MSKLMQYEGFRRNYTLHDYDLLRTYDLVKLTYDDAKNLNYLVHNLSCHVYGDGDGADDGHGRRQAHLNNCH